MIIKWKKSLQKRDSKMQIVHFLSFEILFNCIQQLKIITVRNYFQIISSTSALNSFASFVFQTSDNNLKVESLNIKVLNLQFDRICCIALNKIWWFVWFDLNFSWFSKNELHKFVEVDQVWLYSVSFYDKLNW